MYRFFSMSLLVVFLILVGCETVVDLELEEGPVRLVVDGRIEAVKGGDNSYQEIRLSTTTNFNNGGTPPAVEGATVTIRDGQNREFVFTEDGPGRYVTRNFVAEIRETYVLTIEHNGERYQATEQLMAVSDIDTIYQEYEEGNGFEDAGTRVVIDYTDPAVEENYYYWEQVKNGSRLFESEGGFEALDTDEFYNGQKIIGKRFSSEDETEYEVGDEVIVRQFGISEPAYQYLALLLEQSGGGDLFGTPPVQIRGNMVNQTTPSHYPLGYFYASEVAEAQIVIVEDDGN